MMSLGEEMQPGANREVRTAELEGAQEEICLVCAAGASDPEQS